MDKKVSFSISCIWLFFLLPLAAYAQNSVLSEGGFYKVAITEKGIHKIDASFLSELGIDPATTDPANVAVFGNGGGMLPQKNSAYRTIDLLENPVMAMGGGDGSFSANDYVLFYAEGSDSHYYDAGKRLFMHEQNIYTDTNYYFIKVKSEPALTLVDEPNETATPAITLTTFHDYVIHETDLYNQLDRNNTSAGSGRKWFGEIFEVTTTRDFSFYLPGLVQGSPLHVYTEVMASAPQNSAFYIKAGDNLLDSAAMSAVNSGPYGIKGRVVATQSVHEANGQLASDNLTITVAYDKKGGSGTGFLDFINLNVERRLQLYGNETSFRSKESLEADYVAYQIDDMGEGGKVWNITDPTKPVNQLFEWSNSQASFTAEGQQISEYVAFQGSDFPKPIAIGAIPSQNLHGLSAPNLIIVAADELLTEAQRLASFRQSNDGLTAHAVPLTQVYNEFSSGRADVSAIRDFVRMLYQKNSDPINGLRYVLLFGDASFDYRNILGRNKAMVPVYESFESLHAIYSHSSDDYFAFMDDEEGDWSEVSRDVIHQMELGVGRLPARDVEEAKILVDKLINYQASRSALGDWRNRIAFVGDDGDFNTHQSHADQLATLVEKNYPQLNPDRLLMDAFPQIATPYGKRSPELKEAITQQVQEKGVLILNYSGHGAETGWANENILDNAQIVGWENMENLPLFVTATCEFGRYDDPRATSGAEFSMLSPHGGAIALLTTTRPVFSHRNFDLNKAFYEVVFEPENGEMPRLGNIIKKTKNNSNNGDVLNRNFALLGDPSMRLAYPSEEVVVTKLNGEDIESLEVDTIRALQTIELQGEVRQLGNVSSDFNGSLELAVFDKLSENRTLGEEGANTVMTYYNRDVVLFKGKATVADGKFTASFKVPKDISYQFGEGKISLYASHYDEVRDAGGFLNQLIVGGSYANAPIDDTPPTMDLFMGDESFVSGGITGENTKLLAKLSDDSGINITGNGIGHDITATLIYQGEVLSSYILNDFYEAALDDFRSGTVVFPFNELQPGNYSLEVKAWDNQNNVVSSTVEFRVLGGDELVLDEVVAYPNPFQDRVKLSFMQSQAGSNLEVAVHIYASDGKLVRSFQQDIVDSPSLVNNVEWDGKSDGGGFLGSGLYFAKLYIYHPETNTSTSHVFKLTLTR